MEDSLMNNTNCIEVYSANNILLFKLLLSSADSLPPGNNGNGHGSGNGSYKGKPKQTKKSTNGSGITEPQVRMLFRQMAQKGKSGDIAHEELKAIFNVSSIYDVSKSEASQMIQQLLEENGEG